jgi:hypothetical protein
VILTETEEQIRAHLAARYRDDDADSVELRVRTSMLVQDELLRRGYEHHRSGPCGVTYTAARPWSDAVSRAYTDLDDMWDSRNALG